MSCLKGIFHFVILSSLWALPIMSFVDITKCKSAVLWTVLVISRVFINMRAVRGQLARSCQSGSCDQREPKSRVLITISDNQPQWYIILLAQTFRRPELLVSLWSLGSSLSLWVAYWVVFSPLIAGDQVSGPLSYMHMSTKTINIYEHF